MQSEIVFGFDIGTTSIGSAVVRLDDRGGEILHLGVRIFPEARDPDGIPLNQERRKRRMMRRQIRRRSNRRRALNTLLGEAGLLPDFNVRADSDWAAAMLPDPWALRQRGLAEALAPHELGRALYHLAKRRHFLGRDLDDAEGGTPDKGGEHAADEKKAASQREKDRAALLASGKTLGDFMVSQAETGTRKRGHHFAREDVRAEFAALLAAQGPHHAVLQNGDFVAALEQAIFDQKPVFWRRTTLGECRFMPGADLAASASWVAQEKRMLEKLNNLRIEDGNGRPLDDAERSALLALLRKQDKVSWAGIHRHLKLYWRSHDMPERPGFNLQRGGDDGLVGNRLENRLAAIMGTRWEQEPDLRDRMRREIHARLYAADYGRTGDRIIIRREAERRKAREIEQRKLQADFALTDEQAEAIAKLSFPSGWEPFSEASLWRFLPRLSEGVSFGLLLAGPEEEGWRAATFPERAQPTGSWVDRLPTPGNSQEEMERQKSVRNPTVLRAQNELRKVVNNLISVHGKPDRIRVEVAREVGKSAREREEDLSRNRAREKVRKQAFEDLEKNGVIRPSKADVEKWLLWKECRHVCPYSGDEIGFFDLFGAAPRFDIEHIWPRSLSFDDSFANKTLCRKDVNARKSNRTPLELHAGDAEGLAAVLARVRNFDKRYGPGPAKLDRFSKPVPDGFAARQLTDSGYASRQAVGFLKMLFPDVGPTAEVRVATLSGKVTARLRHVWGLNSILSDTGEKTRADHRHHAIDALVAALAHPGYTQKLSLWFQARDAATPLPAPELAPPIADVREQAERKAEAIVVSHRVRKKVSGPLHNETVYGNAGKAGVKGGTEYNWFVTRKPVDKLSNALLDDDEVWPDPQVRERVRAWVEAHGGNPKKAFVSGYPTVSEGGPPIRKVRIRVKRQAKLMAELKNGFADLGNNHHAIVYSKSGGKSDFRIVSLFEAASRLRKGLSPIDRSSTEELKFKMSLAAGDTVRLSGDRAGLWIVRKLSAKGQITLWPINDTDAEKHKTIFEPTIGGMISQGLEKISVDPIGRIRPAGD